MGNEQYTDQPGMTDLAQTPYQPQEGFEPEVGDRAGAETLLQQGLDHYDREEWAEALNCYQQSLSIDPTFSLAYNNLGMVMIDLERYEEAIEVLQQSIQLDPNFNEAYSNLGFGYRRLGMDLEAASAYARFLELEPEVEEGDRIRQWVQEICRKEGLDQAPPLSLAAVAIPTALNMQNQPSVNEEGGAHWAPVQEALHEGPGQTDLYAGDPLSAEFTPKQSGFPSGPGAAHPHAEQVQKSSANVVPKVKKMAAWEAVMGTPETAAKISATGDYIDDEAPFAGGAISSPGQLAEELAEELIEFQDEEMMDNPAAGGLPSGPGAEPPALPDQRVSGQGMGIAAAKALQTIVTEGDVTEMIEQGMDLFANGDLESAEQHFRQTLTVNPIAAEAHTGLGKVLVRMDRHADGQDALNVAIQLDPDDPSPYYVLGYSLRAEGKEREAAEIYTTFLSLLPDAEDAERIQAWIDQVSSEPAAAPSEPEAQAGFAAGDDGADADAGRGTELSDEGETIENKKFARSLELFQDGDLDGSLRACVKLLNEDPAFFRSRILLGRIYLRQKQYAQAIEQLEGALVTAPDVPEALYFLGQAYERSGQTEDAKRTYEQCVAVAPNAPRSEQLREWLLSQAGVGEAKENTSVQCELCLRMFPSAEISNKDGKKTCQGCLALISGAPQTVDDDSAGIDSESSETGEAEDGWGSPQKTEKEGKTKAPRRQSKGMLLATVGVMLMVGLAVAVSVFPDLVNSKPKDDPETNTGSKKGGVVPPPPTSKNNTAKGFDPTQIKLAGLPEQRAFPYATWSLTPSLAGLEGAPETLKLSYVLKKGPQGLKIDSDKGTITWKPMGGDFDALSMGFREIVELEITGSLPNDPKPLFNREVRIPLTYQFGFSRTEAENIGLKSGDQVCFETGDFDGDGLEDVIAGIGQYGKGSVQYRFARRGHSSPSIRAVEETGRIAAIWTTDLDHNGTHDLLTANHYSGDIKAFVQNEKNVLEERGTFNAGPGPVWITASDLDQDKTLEVAVLLGRKRSVVLTSYTKDKGFGTPTDIQLNVGGPKGWIYPWRSPEKGNGFVVVSPLDPYPLWLISWKNGKPGPLVPSNLDVKGMVVGAAPLRIDPQAEPGLALLINDKGGAMRLIDDSQGTFNYLKDDRPLVFAELALSFAVADLNRDKLDDVVVTFRNAMGIWFRVDKGFEPGPFYKDLEPLEGSVFISDSNQDGSPDILLITEDRKLLSFRSKIATVSNTGGSSQEASGWPYAAEVKAVVLGEAFRIPTRDCLIRIPIGWSQATPKDPELDLAVTGPDHAQGQSKAFVAARQGPPQPMDETARRLLSARYPGLEWIGKPQIGTLHKAQALRAEAQIPGESHMVWYILDWGDHHARIQLIAPEKVWEQDKFALEAIARNLASVNSK